MRSRASLFFPSCVMILCPSFQCPNLLQVSGAWQCLACHSCSVCHYFRGIYAVCHSLCSSRADALVYAEILHLVLPPPLWFKPELCCTPSLLRASDWKSCRSSFMRPTVGRLDKTCRSRNLCRRNGPCRIRIKRPCQRQRPCRCFLCQSQTSLPGHHRKQAPSTSSCHRCPPCHSQLGLPGYHSKQAPSSCSRHPWPRVGACPIPWARCRLRECLHPCGRQDCGFLLRQTRGALRMIRPWTRTRGRRTSCWLHPKCRVGHSSVLHLTSRTCGGWGAPTKPGWRCGACCRSRHQAAHSPLSSGH